MHFRLSLAVSAVSIIPPKIPDGEFSSVRLQGRYVRRCLPVDCEFFASCSLHPPFVHLAFRHPILVLSRGDLMRWHTSVRAAFTALPQGPSLRSGL